MHFLRVLKRRLHRVTVEKRVLKRFLIIVERLDHVKDEKSSGEFPRGEINENTVNEFSNESFNISCIYLNRTI